ncbi:glycosyltransferase family 2 protein [Pseudooceanicola sp. LIPI14-2-Ac024]|uniref:glycosyltransferase family 2 protein n=1 Tax=Pseudooceanicola sp. LIPI14-2-Ac024 TaxID=3344875 RepID=UPI0035D02653
MADKGADRLTYPGGFDAVLARMEGRRDPMTFGPGEGFPSADADLAQLRDRKLGKLPEALRKSPSGFAAKARELAREFHDAPSLCHLNAMVIACLRRRDQPPGVAALFQAIWRDHGAFLIEHLDARWLVSSVTTFGDHGTTETQRRTGLALAVLFNTMKLHETERLFSGTAPDTPFARRKAAATLALDMDPFAIVGGGLDVNMLGRLWVEAGEDPVIAPLAHHLLDALNADPRTVFRRLHLMREAREARAIAASQSTHYTPHPEPQRHPAPVDPARVETDPAKLRWGVVSTIRAPLPEIARFAAWHIAQGAARVSLYLDDADPAKAAWLSRHPAVEVTLCDDAHWQAIGRRPHTHQVRQSTNATACYRASDLHWLAHLDVDEFLLPSEPLATILAGVPADIGLVMVPPVERLASDAAGPALFKTTARMAGHPSTVLPQVYPTFGAHLRGGYLSHLEGKCIARTALPGVELNIHRVKRDGDGITNSVTLTDSYLGHDHAPSWEVFRDKMAFRLTQGSYRNPEGREFRLADMLAYLEESEGEAGLRQFYDEVCTATPDRLAALEAHGMLIRRDIDLDGAVRDVFGAPPPDPA